MVNSFWKNKEQENKPHLCVLNTKLLRSEGINQYKIIWYNNNNIKIHKIGEFCSTEVNVSLTKQTHLLGHPLASIQLLPHPQFIIYTVISLPITTCLRHPIFHYLHLSFLQFLCAIIAPSSIPHVSWRLIPAPICLCPHWPVRRHIWQSSTVYQEFHQATMQLMSTNNSLSQLWLCDKVWGSTSVWVLNRELYLVNVCFCNGP